MEAGVGATNLKHLISLKIFGCRDGSGRTIGVHRRGFTDGLNPFRNLCCCIYRVTSYGFSVTSVCDTEHLSIMSLVLIVGMCHGEWTSEKFTDFVSIGFSDDRVVI